MHSQSAADFYYASSLEIYRIGHGMGVFGSGLKEVGIRMSE